MSDSDQRSSKESNPRLENPPTMGTGKCFEEAWTDLRPRLHRMLTARGVPADVADDIVQEAAIKLLSNWQRLDLQQPLWPLARTITLNCLADNYRRVQPVPVAELPDAPAAYDIEAHGLARARLSVVGKAMRTLRKADRTTLLEAVEADRPARNSSAAKMARLRARKRLMTALERTASVFSAIPLTYRRFQIWIQSHPFAEVQGAAASVGTTAVAMALVFAPADPAYRPRDPLPGDGTKHHPIKVATAASSWSRPTTTPRERDRPSVKRAPMAVPETSGAGTSAPPTDPVTQAPTQGPAEKDPRAKDDDSETKVGPTRTGTDEGEGYKQAHVCTGEETSAKEDDQAVTVTYYDGSQDGSDEPEGCE